MSCGNLAADVDAEFVCGHTREQNQNLDIVGGAAADIKRLAYVSDVTTCTCHSARLAGVDYFAMQLGSALAIEVRT